MDDSFKKVKKNTLLLKSLPKFQEIVTFLPQYVYMIDVSVQKYFRNKDNLSMKKIMNFSFFYNLTKPTHLHPKGLKVAEEERKS